MVSIRPKSVLVIGGGPGGLVSLRNLTELGGFGRVELVERRDDVGGVWYLDDPQDGDPKSRWPSPSYPGLVGNVLPEHLSFSGHPFPEPPTTPHQPFPTLVQTYEYLRSFAEPYLKNGQIKLNTEVTCVEELADGTWRVSYNDWNDKGNRREELWDAIVVAVGWYDNLVWPETEGLEQLKERNIAIHSKWWRGPTGYEGKRILVIGNANSSNDIAAQLAPVANNPVYRSIRRPAFPGFPNLPDERILDVAPVANYALSETNKVTATLTDGTVISDIDNVFIGTGYQPNPDFVYLLNAEKAKQSLMNPPVIPHRTPSLHRYILNAHNPSLSFVLSTMTYTPFTLADLQSAWLALAWRGEVPYPDSIDGRLEFETERLKAIEKFRSESDNPSALWVYGVLGAFEQEYAAALKADIVAARPELKDVLPEWNDERTKKRETMYPIKYKALEWTRDQSKRSQV